MSAGRDGDGSQVVQMFLVEGRELLAELEAGFLSLESGAANGDPALIHTLFRAAHTIKGSAGIVGVDSLMAFTHHVETLMDRVRAGDLLLDGAVITLLLRCCDHMAALMNLAEAGDMDAPALAGAGQALVDALARQSGGHTAAAPAIESTAAAAGSSTPVSGAAAGSTVVPADEGNSGLLRALVYLDGDSLRNGFDPGSAVQYLAQHATVTRALALSDRVPALNDLDPEACYLAFAIELEGTQPGEVAEAFTFFGGDTTVVEYLACASAADKAARLAALHARLDAAQVAPWIAAGWFTGDEWAGRVGVAEQANEQGHTQGATQGAAPTTAAPEAHVPAVAPTHPASVATPATSAAGSGARFVKVPADRLDQLINLVGELVVATAGVELQARETRSEALAESLSSLTTLIETIQSGALQLRMVPIGDTFSRFTRVVRDMARELGKDIALQIEGADTELDKSMVERLADPLMHLVRNAIDHGIEAPAERLAAGKPAAATLRLRARHEAGSVVVEVADDGRGLNRERIRAKAIERGLISAEAVLSDSEIHQLIFEPGFSTASAVTNLSGRGVGMDVVKSSIEALRGAITLHSEPGQGARITMRLPLTLAIIDGFMVGVGSARLIVPLDMVIECIEMPEGALDPGTPRYMNLRGEVLPYVCLRDFFGLEGGGLRRRSVVVVRFGEQKAGILVDTLHGEIQTVIKPLSRVFKHLKTICGTSILGSGDIALIVDVHQLLLASIDRHAEQATRPASAQRAVAANDGGLRAIR